MREIRIKRVTILLAALIGVYILFIGIRARASFEVSPEQIAMEVTYGFGNTAKGGRYVPVTIDLELEKEEIFQGKIQILAMEASTEFYQYERPIELENGKAHQEIINVPLAARGDLFYVKLLDSSGKEVLSKRLKLDINPNVTELFLGIVSDHNQELSYMDGIGLNYNSLVTKCIYLDEHTIPEESLQLDLLDVLLITDYNIGQLSKEQINAVLDWVNNGGTLLLGTGARVDDTLGEFTDYLAVDSYRDPELVSVNLGVEFASNGPQDAYQDLLCVNLILKNGDVISQSDEYPLITKVNQEKGVIGVAAYDFKDIAEFCRHQPSYLEKLFRQLIGEENLTLITQESQYGNATDFWSVQSMINTGNVNKLPNVLLYIIVIIVYVLFSGIGLYLLLKRYDLSRHFRLSVILVSGFFTILIYAMGRETRFSAPFFTYATILDVGEKQITDNTFFNVRAPYNKPYSVSVDNSYSLLPITQDNYVNYDQKLPAFYGTENYNVSIHYGEDKNLISIQDIVAFTPKLFKLEKRYKHENGTGIQGEVTLFDGKVFGSIKNTFDFPLENTAILLYGQVIIVDKLDSGETIDLSTCEVVRYPMNFFYNVAKKISGSNKYKHANISDPQYMLALERANIMEYYMKNYFSGYTQAAKLVTFQKEEQKIEFIQDDTYDAYGITMLVTDISVNYQRDGQIFRPALSKPPNVVSGEYDFKTNMMYGLDPLVMEYYLGNDLTIEKLDFNNELYSKEDEEDYKYYYYKPFSGKMYFYNYDTDSYDEKNLSQKSFQLEELKPYLSPGNTITIKFIGEKTEDYRWDNSLPVLSVVGREK